MTGLTKRQMSIERRGGQHVPLDVRRLGEGVEGAHLARARRRGHHRGRPRGGFRLERRPPSLELALEHPQLGGVDDALGQLQAAHARPGRRPPCRRRPGRCDLSTKLRRQRRPAHQHGHVHAGAGEVLGGGHHLVGALHQQARQPEDVRAVLLHRGDQLLGRDLDAEVHHLKAVVGENDLHEVLADVVDVAFHRGQHHLAARLRWWSCPSSARGSSPPPSSPRRSAAPRPRSARWRRRAGPPRPCPS